MRWVRSLVVFTAFVGAVASEPASALTPPIPQLDGLYRALSGHPLVKVVL